MGTKTYISRLFGAVTSEEILGALQEARNLEEVGRSIADFPGSGQSTVHFVSYEGQLFPSKAVLRQAIRIAGHEPIEDNLDFNALQAQTVLERHGFETVSLTSERKETSQDNDTRVSNRQKRLAEILSRPQQAKFRKEVLMAYGGKCVISGTSLTEVLQAAHVFPVSMGGSDDVSNGIPLRSDIHLLFDLGLIEVNQKTLCIELSEELPKEYQVFVGSRIDAPDRHAFLKNLKLRGKNAKL